MRSRYARVRPYTTKDGSLIRELMHPSRQGNRRQSLAEAQLPPGSSTRLHRHRRSEELYHITSGKGLMTLGGKTFPVTAGDTLGIAPGTPHRLHNTGRRPLKVLCCCAPPYSHEDTELL
jgi:mannose-6-phosphate isomerase-like protein (cupin superfamily)